MAMQKKSWKTKNNTTTPVRVKSVPYEPILIDMLKDHVFAEMYLAATIEDGDPRYFVKAINRIAKALGSSSSID
jgi:DNA-binding phage protein